MIPADAFRRDDDFQLLRTMHDPAEDAYWCFMHANRVPVNGYRACFSPALIKEIREYQRATAERITRSDASERSYLSHLVLASDADVFNLGGDLDLFSRLIRERNRKHLLAYARQCVEGVFAFHAHQGRRVHSIALVQGDALGGGFEAALSCQTIVAESGVGMGFPEVLFDLFPGMGAWSFLCKRVSPKLAEEMMLSGNIYSSDELYKLGLVDVLVPKGEGVCAVHDCIRRNRRIPHARVAMDRVRDASQPVVLGELMRITEIWVDTALQLGEKSLRTMERLVRAQVRRPAAKAAPTNIVPLPAAALP